MDQETLNNIERLHRLKGEGVITEEEFDQAKRKYLFGSAPATARPAAPPGSMEEHLAWITLPLKRYADFHGRSSRKEFWLFQLIPLTIVMACSIIATSTADMFGDYTTPGILAIMLTIVAMLVLLVPMLAVEVRRFHDQGRSGWLVLMNLIPYVGWIIVYVFMLLEGIKGDNEYGPDPRHGGPSTEPSKA